MRTRPFAAAVVAAVALTACGGTDPEPAAAEFTVVTTTDILHDLATEVFSEAAPDVDAVLAPVMPAGADPHTYAPSASAIRSINDADLVISIGLGLETGLDDALDALAEQDPGRVLALGALVDPEPFEGDHRDEEEAEDEHDLDGDHEEHGDDPHVWLDPVRVAAMAELIADAYAARLPEHAEALRAGGAAVAARYEALAEELAEVLAVVPDDARQLVTNHDAFGYYARRFDLEVIATVLPGSTAEAQPTATDFVSLVETLEAAGVTTVFTEPGVSDRLAESLRGQVAGLELVELYAGSLGPSESDADTLAGLLRVNTARIAGALG